MKYKDEKFEEREVVLDGADFENCTFERCRLIYEGGSLPTFRGGTTFSNSTFALEGAAGRSMKYLGMLQAIGAGNIVEQAFAALNKSIKDDAR
jgi:hypothetical protein